MLCCLHFHHHPKGNCGCPQPWRCLRSAWNDPKVSLLMALGDFKVPPSLKHCGLSMCSDMVLGLSRGSAEPSPCPCSWPAQLKVPPACHSCAPMGPQQGGHRQQCPLVINTLTQAAWDSPSHCDSSRKPLAEEIKPWQITQGEPAETQGLA